MGGDVAGVGAVSGVTKLLPTNINRLTWRQAHHEYEPFAGAPDTEGLLRYVSSVLSSGDDILASAVERYLKICKYIDRMRFLPRHSTFEKRIYTSIHDAISDYLLGRSQSAIMNSMLSCEMLALLGLLLVEFRNQRNNQNWLSNGETEPSLAESMRDHSKTGFPQRISRLKREGLISGTLGGELKSAYNVRNQIAHRWETDLGDLSGQSLSALTTMFELSDVFLGYEIANGVLIYQCPDVELLLSYLVAQESG